MVSRSMPRIKRPVIGAVLPSAFLNTPRTKRERALISSPRRSLPAEPPAIDVRYPEAPVVMGAAVLTTEVSQYLSSGVPTIDRTTCLAIRRVDFRSLRDK